ncbi:hypothetical protein Tco_0880868 [Tanacetum coccineum]
MKGGIRIECDEITIYKKVTRIKTSNQTEVVEVAITELGVREEEFMEINKSIYFNQEGSKAFLEQFKPVIDRLKHQGYIGEEPLKHWKKNGKLCKIDIINPDITIEDRYCCCHLLEILSCYSDQWLYFVDIPKQIWALHCMIAYRLCMALTASFAAESSMSWATDLHALDLSILIGVWLALSCDLRILLKGIRGL